MSLLSGVQLGEVRSRGDTWIDFKRVKWVPDEYMRLVIGERTVWKRGVFSLGHEHVLLRTQPSRWFLGVNNYYGGPKLHPTVVSPELTRRLMELSQGALVLLSPRGSYSIQLKPEDLPAFSVWLDHQLEMGRLPT